MIKKMCFFNINVNSFVGKKVYLLTYYLLEPPKHAIEACITKWTAKTKKEPTHTDTEFIKNMWISKDKVKKLLGFFTTARLIQDLKATEPNEVLSRGTVCGIF